MVVSTIGKTLRLWCQSEIEVPTRLMKWRAGSCSLSWLLSLIFLSLSLSFSQQCTQILMQDCVRVKTLLISQAVQLHKHIHPFTRIHAGTHSQNTLWNTNQWIISHIKEEKISRLHLPNLTLKKVIFTITLWQSGKDRQGL